MDGCKFLHCWCGFGSVWLSQSVQGIDAFFQQQQQKTACLQMATMKLACSEYRSYMTQAED